MEKITFIEQKNEFLSSQCEKITYKNLKIYFGNGIYRSLNELELNFNLLNINKYRRGEYSDLTPRLYLYISHPIRTEWQNGRYDFMANRISLYAGNKNSLASAIVPCLQVFGGYFESMKEGRVYPALLPDYEIIKEIITDLNIRFFEFPIYTKDDLIGKNLQDAGHKMLKNNYYEYSETNKRVF